MTDEINSENFAFLRALLGAREDDKTSTNQSATDDDLDDTTRATRALFGNLKEND